MTPTVPLKTVGQGGPFHVCYEVDGKTMCFMYPKGFVPTVRQVSEFAAQIAVGGAAEYSSEAYAPLKLESFEHGGDKETFEAGDLRYQWSDGKVALHRKHLVTLASQWALSDPSVTPTARQILDFVTTNGSYIVVAVGTKLRSYNTATGAWSDEQPSGGAFASNAIYMFSNDQYLFCANGSGANYWRWDGIAATGWAQPGAGFLRNGFGWWKNTLYSFYTYNLYAATANDGSTWAAAIPVGWPSTNITDLIDAGSLLVIVKPEGLFVYDGTNVNRVVDWSNIHSAGNGVGLGAWEGSIYLPRLHQVFKASVSTDPGITLADITPSMRQRSLDKEQYGHGQLVRWFAGPRMGYGAFNAGENLYPELLGYNGVGFHQIYRGTAGIQVSESYDSSNQDSDVPVGNQYGADTTGSGTATASSSATGRPPGNAVDDLNAAATDAWVTNSTTTGWWKYDFGVGITKTIQRVSIQAQFANPTRSPRDFTIQGSNDDAAYTTLFTATGESTWTEVETRVFSFVNATAYRYYKIDVTANDGHATALAIGELELLEVSSIKSPLAQIFTLSAETDLNLVQLWLKRVNRKSNLSEALTLRIETTSSGEPTGTLADPNATGSSGVSTLATAYDQVSFTLASQVTLAAGVYAIVLTSASSLGDAIWGADGSAPGYAGGAMYSKTSGVWNAESKDACFALFTEGGAPGTLYAAGYSRTMGWLLLNDGHTRRKRVVNASDAEYPDYAPSGQFTTPNFDAGFPDVFKSISTIQIDAKQVDADNTILVEYDLDDASNWQTVGTINSTANGGAVLTVGGSEGQVTCKRIRFRFTLTRDATDVTDTPVIELPIIIRLLVRPQAYDAYVDLFALGPGVNLHDGGAYSEQYPDIAENLDFVDVLRRTTSTIRRTDRHGRRRRVLVMDKSSSDPEWFASGQQSPQINIVAQDAFGGGYMQVDETFGFTETFTSSVLTFGNGYGFRSYGYDCYGVVA